MEEDGQLSWNRQVIDVDEGVEDHGYAQVTNDRNRHGSSGCRSGHNHQSEAVWDEMARFEDITDDNVRGMEFDSTEEAESFYLVYGRAKGFCVRKSLKSKDKDGLIRRWSWLCSKEGRDRRSTSTEGIELGR